MAEDELVALLTKALDDFGSPSPNTDGHHLAMVLRLNKATVVRLLINDDTPELVTAVLAQWAVTDVDAGENAQFLAECAVHAVTWRNRTENGMELTDEGGEA